ncbi:MAG TPA: peroxiredoxin-like family protein [Puia sp.]|nr:peroxiredoxin-like family protein [Puia sp.]
MKYMIIAIGIFFSTQVVAQTGLKEGAKAPEFVAMDNSGQKIDLNNILKSHKAVVLFFYRGQWCPYCNRYIQRMQDSLQLLMDKGAYVIAVTPETPSNIEKTIEKTHASFSIVQDRNYQIMKDYQVNYTVDDVLLSRLNTYGVDLEKNNGNKDHVLPVPATYIIDPSGTIIFVHFNKDYTQRPSIKTLLGKI